MYKSLLLTVAMVLTLAVAGQARNQSGSDVEDLSKPAGREPPMMGIHRARGFNPLFLAGKAGHTGGRGNLSTCSGITAQSCRTP